VIVVRVIIAVVVIGVIHVLMVPVVAGVNVRTIEILLERPPPILVRLIAVRNARIAVRIGVIRKRSLARVGHKR
jgi:hypothetical protein